MIVSTFKKARSTQIGTELDDIQSHFQSVSEESWADIVGLSGRHGPACTSWQRRSSPPCPTADCHALVDCQLTTTAAACEAGMTTTLPVSTESAHHRCHTQGSHSFNDKKSRTFPGLSRTPMKNFSKPFRSPWMFKGPWTPKLTYTFYPFSWKCRIFW